MEDIALSQMLTEVIELYGKNEGCMRYRLFHGQKRI